jgi:poly(3-hydroxybutyrate) depolymerase
MYRLGKDYEKPAFEIDTTTINGETVGIMERTGRQQAVLQAAALQERPGRQKDRRARSSRPCCWSRRCRATIDAAARHRARPAADHDVFITDWTDARMVPLSDGPFHLDDYIYYVQDFIRHLGPDVHVISVCQPTVPVLAAISLMATNKDPKLPKTMTMMGGPIDPRKSPTAVNDLATEKPFSWFENTVIYAVPGNYPGFGRKVYPGFLQHAGFIAMNPGRHAQSHREFYQHLVRGDDDSGRSHRKFYDEYNAVLDMPAEYYLDTIKTVFQDFALPKGTWEVGGQLVRPQDIKTVALFTVEGELDDISGAGQTQAAHDLCSGIPADMQQRLRGAESAATTASSRAAAGAR